MLHIVKLIQRRFPERQNVIINSLLLFSLVLLLIGGVMLA